MAWCKDNIEHNNLGRVTLIELVKNYPTRTTNFFESCWIQPLLSNFTSLHNLDLSMSYTQLEVFSDKKSLLYCSVQYFIVVCLLYINL
jgi:hypothetical protein